MSQNSDETHVTDELRKLATIATDLQMPGKMRSHAIDQLGQMASHEALLVLLNLVANDKLHIDERDLALKRAREIVRKGR
jgi:hypothetical protein